MQDIIVEKPYRFVPPHRGTKWSAFIQRFRLFDRYLRKSEGVVDHEVRFGERVRESIDAGHGVLITPNHCRTADPIVMGFLARSIGCHVYAMASWHLFNQKWLTAFAIHKMGGFSVNREGVDKKSISTAIQILKDAERPLILFPEGAVTRTNDRLHGMLDGVAFIARSAAKKRAQSGQKVVVHPIAIKYLYQGDIHTAASQVLDEIERRFSWSPQKRLPLPERVEKLGAAMLTLKEIEYLGEPQTGAIQQRLDTLISHLLEPLEEKWLKKKLDGGVIPRVKAIRMQILPDMIQGKVSDEERSLRWVDLGKLYLAQQLSCYPSDYLELPTKDRYLETIERFEEDLTDKARIHGQLKVVLEVDEAVEVSPERDRSWTVDPLMTTIHDRLDAMLQKLAMESPLIEPKDGTQRR